MHEHTLASAARLSDEALIAHVMVLSIEYHHANEPYSLGGEATVQNISLRCRTHNVYESELIFGPFDPSRVRETLATYERSVGPVTGPGTSRAACAVNPSAPAKGATR